MPSAKVLFQPGWTLHQPTKSMLDPITGEPIPGPAVRVEGIGLLQERLFTQMEETTSTAVKDERLVMFAPTVAPIEGLEIQAEDEFTDPQGRRWHAITDGFPRGIPGQTPEYIATRVRRAKEKDQ